MANELKTYRGKMKKKIAPSTRHKTDGDLLKIYAKRFERKATPYDANEWLHTVQKRLTGAK